MVHKYHKSITYNLGKAMVQKSYNWRVHHLAYGFKNNGDAQGFCVLRVEPLTLKEFPQLEVLQLPQPGVLQKPGVHPNLDMCI